MQFAKIIILPHPGGERLPSRRSNRVPWPPFGAAHRRKFLQAPGEWALSTGESGDSLLEFWGEYEGPTFCSRLPPGRGLPQAVHSIDPRPEPPTRNTDPWVFHQGFVWSLCRHKNLPTIVPSGTVVLFGSTVSGEWLLDTVFVVNRRIAGVAGKIGGPYDRLVLPTIPGAFQPFIGIPYTTAAELFSFVPARRIDNEHKPFRRPSMNSLFSLLRKGTDRQPPSPRNAQGLAVCTAIGGVRSFWNALVRETEEAGLVLGTLFHHPSRVDELPTGAATSTACGELDVTRPPRSPSCSGPC